ncbi:hypothetical protein AB4648_13300 [Vibrio splendidus]
MATVNTQQKTEQEEQAHTVMAIKFSGHKKLSSFLRIVLLKATHHALMFQEVRTDIGKVA